MGKKNILKVIFLGIILLLVIGFIRNNQNLLAQKTVVEQTRSIVDDKIQPTDSFPTLNPPQESFQKDSSGKKIENLSNPTTKTTIEQYSNKIVPLIYQSMDVIKQKITETWGEEYDSTWISAAEKNFKEFGILATNYLPLARIVSIDKFDVDGDSLTETILNHISFDSADGGLNWTDIIKGNKIIFSAQEIDSIIVKADTNNGFFVKWQNESLSWVDGYMRTRFEWRDNQFVPIYEQEVRFVKK